MIGDLSVRVSTTPLHLAVLISTTPLHLASRFDRPPRCYGFVAAGFVRYVQYIRSSLLFHPTHLDAFFFVNQSLDDRRFVGTRLDDTATPCGTHLDDTATPCISIRQAAPLEAAMALLLLRSSGTYIIRSYCANYSIRLTSTLHSLLDPCHNWHRGRPCSHRTSLCPCISTC
jgi:hypothetical protein